MRGHAEGLARRKKYAVVLAASYLAIAAAFAAEVALYAAATFAAPTIYAFSNAA